MRNQRVYDLPVRIFHWIFAALFTTAFAIAKLIDSESPLYSYHMLVGLTLVYIVALRIIWGFVGTKYSRFTSFVLNPKSLLTYFTDMLSGAKTKWAGHNPASSWAAIIMFGLSVGLGITGYLMTSGGDKEAYEDIHELFANAFVIVVLSHIAGVVLHTLRHRDNIGLSMLDGKKQNIPADAVISNTRPIVASVFIVLIAVFAINLITNYDVPTQTLKLFGTNLNLGDSENNEGGAVDDDGDDD